MKAETVYPDIYPSFKCKCGSCRHVCCNGWGITVSEAEYYRLVGLQCKKALRHKLDSAFVPVDFPEPCRFASISPDFRGYCPMLSSEGFCSLQLECGEAALPLVCKVYPRSVKAGAIHEISTSLGCEKTVELLMESTEPVSFRDSVIELPFDGIELTDCSHSQSPLRFDCIKILQNRQTASVGLRLLSLGTYLTSADTPAPSDDLPGALAFIARVICEIEKTSPNIRDCGFRALSYLGTGDSGTGEQAPGRYLAARGHIYKLIPSLEAFYEKIMVCHMFYEQFPYVSLNVSTVSAYSSLIIVYALLRLITICDMAESNDINDFTDTVSELFRFTEHSDFYSVRQPDKIAKGTELWRLLSPLLI